VTPYLARDIGPVLAQRLQEPRGFLTVTEAADALNVSRRTLYRLALTGQLATVKVGASRRSDRLPWSGS
jgi:excisionase family DNA binding protein